MYRRVWYYTVAHCTISLQKYCYNNIYRVNGYMKIAQIIDYSLHKIWAVAIAVSYGGEKELDIQIQLHYLVL